jgi:hypothetical protein
LATLLLPIGVFGFLEYYRQRHIDLRVVAFLAVGFAVGVTVIADETSQLANMDARSALANAAAASAVAAGSVSVSCTSDLMFLPTFASIHQRHRVPATLGELGSKDVEHMLDLDEKVGRWVNDEPM